MELLLRVRWMIILTMGLCAIILYISTYSILYISQIQMQFLKTFTIETIKDINDIRLQSSLKCNCEDLNQGKILDFYD
jgi:hypothetical protein